MAFDQNNFLSELQRRLSELIRQSPAEDIERNVKALLGQTFQRLELVTREEFDVQTDLLKALQARAVALEDQVRRLEERLGQQPR